MITTTPALDRQSRALSPAPITASGRDDSLPDTADQRLGLDLVATLGLTAYSVTVAVGFSRVFFEWDFLRDLVLIAVAGHGASYVLRRLRAPSFVAIPLLLLGLTWLVAWIYYRDTFSSVFPLSDTWNTVRDDYRVVQDEFQSTTPPVVYDAGWAFLAGATTAATVWLSDTFAFRAQARGEALVPGAVLFVFIAALGVDEHRVACSLAVIGAGFVALALLRLRLERRPRTVLGRARHPLLTITPGVVCAAALVMAGAWAIAPRLPGADADPLFDTHNRRRGVTEIVSPLVDIRSRIVNQANTEMFTVAADARRRTGGSRRCPGSTATYGTSPIPRSRATATRCSAAAAGAEPNDQLVTIEALDGSIVPAAPEPVSASIRSDDGGMSWFADSSVLIKTDNDLDEGDEFAIRSAMPRFTADALRAATSDNPPDAMFLDLPDDLPPEVAETAAEVTAGASTNFDRMVMLQDWFRSEFRYDTEIPDGHGSPAIVAFLEDRVGYCEQFSGTFAAMARTLGIPARVVVGFTQGQFDDGVYRVLGRNAHAWPEVWFDGFGWVPFEPTPGRGIPGAEAYTGIEPQPETGDTTEPTTTTLPPTTTTVAGQTPPPGQETTTTPPPPPTTTPLDLEHTFVAGFPWLYVIAGTLFVGHAHRAPRRGPALAPETARPDHRPGPCAARPVGQSAQGVGRHGVPG